MSDSMRRDRQLGYKWQPEMSNTVRRLGKADIELLRSGVCPFCHAGPYTVAAAHVNKAHGIDREELRVMLGVSQDTTICDPTHSASTSERIKQRNGPDWSKEAQKNSDRKAAGQKTSARCLAKVRDRDALIAADFDAGLSYREIAERRGVHARTVREVVHREGLYDADGRTRRGARERGELTENLKKGVKAWQESTEKERQEIVAAIDGGETIRRVAARLGTTPIGLRNRMYRHGIKLPKDSERSYRTTYEKRPPWYCGMPDCEREGNCQGLCRMHYQRAKAAAKAAGISNADAAKAMLSP